jgi:DNA-binding transcriptional LysR family regulator
VTRSALPAPPGDRPDVAPSNINFKLRQLALLSALAETGTLRAAAARINVSQPGATRLLHELEVMLGVALFDRVKGKMIVTPAGETMIGHANALQSEMLLAWRQTQEAATGNAGQIKLGIFSSIAPDMLSSALQGFTAQLPRVRLSVIEAPQNLLIGALRRYEIDAVVGRLFNTDSAEDLAYDMLYSESFCVVCGPDHPLASAGREVDESDLAHCNWVLADPGTALRQRVDAHFLARTGQAPQGTIETRSLLTHLALLSTSEHVGLLPTGLARFLERTGQVRIVMPSLGDIEGAVTFITRLDAPARKSVEVLRGALRRAATDAR